LTPVNQYRRQISADRIIDEGILFAANNFDFVPRASRGRMRELRLRIDLANVL
jgi:hypothetical protein